MAFIVRRIATYAVAAWVAITVNFLIPRLMPGDVVSSYMARFPGLNYQAYKALEVIFGTGHQGGIFHQYWAYLVNLSHGNLGTSINFYPDSVASIIKATLMWTLILVGTATIISFVLGTLLGIVAGWRRGGRFDQLLPAFTFLQAIPYFFLALLLIEGFAIHLGWFPAEGGESFGVQVGWNWPFIQSAVYHSLLPAFTLVAASMAGWMLQMRNVMITTIGEDYVLAAQAKGLSNRRVVMTYAARNAILPNIAGFAISLGYVVAGALVMELVFSFPGIGFTLYNAVVAKDFALMQGIFLVIVAAVLFANLIADAIYVIADPRTRTRAAY
jgi:peptide/nickel transport system permease protein